uniref:Putative secreted protein n=1 Tax=Amblyomma triste TaxID=251400 RepID=A0A023G0V1_AMBTT
MLLFNCVIFPAVMGGEVIRVEFLKLRKCGLVIVIVLLPSPLCCALTKLCFFNDTLSRKFQSYAGCQMAAVWFPCTVFVA